MLNFETKEVELNYFNGQRRERGAPAVPVPHFKEGALAPVQLPSSRDGRLAKQTIYQPATSLD